VRLVDERLHLGEIVLLSADGVGLGEHAARAAELDDLGEGTVTEGGNSSASQCPPVAPIA
jgi:hypothetical protein